MYYASRGTHVAYLKLNIHEHQSAYFIQIVQVLENKLFLSRVPFDMIS